MNDSAQQATDPVCGMHVDPSTALSLDVDGRAYYFCSQSCRDRFASGQAGGPGHAKESCCHHGSGAGPKATVPTSVDPSAVYTCPMHPEVEQIGFGQCPKCGMDLEPKQITLDDLNNSEQYDDMLRRFTISAALSVPLLVLAMGPMIGIRFFEWLPESASGLVWGWLQFALATPVVFGCGLPLLSRGVRSFVTGNLNMFSLILLGTMAAYAISMVALVFPAWLPETFFEGGRAPLYFEAAAVITTLVLLGQVLELSGRQKTSSAVASLLRLTPEVAHRLNESSDQAVSAPSIRQLPVVSQSSPSDAPEDVAIADVVVGDLLLIRPGEQVPVDGTLVRGQGHVDESMITGEPVPVFKHIGDGLTGGTLNQSGALVMRAQAVGNETVLAKIVQMVGQAQRSRVPMQDLVDTVAYYFVPAVLLCAALSFAGWWLWGPEPSFRYAVTAAVSVLVIACPCAMGLATPMSVMVGVGRGAQAGVLIKDAAVLQAMQQVQVIVVDKTGTLTQGSPEVYAVQMMGDWDRDDVMARIGAIEQNSEHPLAQAIVRYARSLNVKFADAEAFENTAGGGVQATVGSSRVMIGSPAFLRQSGCSIQAIEQWASDHQDDAATIVLVAIDDELAAALAIKDPIKPSAPAAIQSLGQMGVRVAMLTGDARRTAQAVAKNLGIEVIGADASPADKHACIERLQHEGTTVAMAGDGINDAPALALADVGIAMGTGSNVAIESAGITLVGGELSGLVTACQLSHDVMRNIRQNLFFAFAYNVLGIPVAAGLLYPVTGTLLSPMLAAGAMSLSSVCVIVNALRLGKAKRSRAE